MIECILQIAGKKENSKHYCYFEKKVFFPVIPPIGGQIHDWTVKNVNYQFGGSVLITLQFFSPWEDYGRADILDEYKWKLLSNGGFEEKDFRAIKRASVL